MGLSVTSIGLASFVLQLASLVFYAIALGTNRFAKRSHEIFSILLSVVD